MIHWRSAAIDSQSKNTSPASRIYVSVIMERRQGRQGPWPFTRWQALGVTLSAQQSAQAPRRSLVRDDGESRQYLWSGFPLTLHKDGTESYWYNLVGKQPSLFVICRRDGDDMRPITISADYDEAGAYMETEGEVFPAPMPPDIYQWLEHYTMDNYQPGERKQRKRKKWTDDPGFEK